MRFYNYNKDEVSEMTDMNIIRLILFGEMQKQSVTYDQLSERTGIPKSSLQRYMSGERDFPLDRFETVCAALGRKPSQVLGWEPKEDPKTEAVKEFLDLLPRCTPSDQQYILDLARRLAGRS